MVTTSEVLGFSFDMSLYELPNWLKCVCPLLRPALHNNNLQHPVRMVEA